MSDEIETNETEQVKADKAEKKFNSVISRLTAIVGGREKLKISKKTPKDELGALVQELFKEERETTLAETKASLKALLKQYAEMEKAVELKRRELEKLAKDKKSEFVKAAEAVFAQIEDVGDIEKMYYSALKTTGSDA